MTRTAALVAVLVVVFSGVVSPPATGQVQRALPSPELQQQLDDLIVGGDTEDEAWQQMAAGASVQQFTLLSTSVDLEPVSLAELLSLVGGTTFDMGAWRGAGTLDSGLQSMDPVVEREERFLWAARLRWSDLGGVVVQYELEGDDGTSGALTCVADPDSQISAQISDAAPFWIPVNRNFVWLVGGPRFSLSLGGARRAGSYSGTLTVTVNSL